MSLKHEAACFLTISFYLLPTLILKTYSLTNLNKDAASRYSPVEVVKKERTIIRGMPDIRRIPVTEIFRGQTIWQGEVEVFDLNGHPKAKRAYGWSHKDGKDDKGGRFVTVLENQLILHMD